jgi:hypothetical protein
MVSGFESQGIAVESSHSKKIEIKLKLRASRVCLVCSVVLHVDQLFDPAPIP